MRTRPILLCGLVVLFVVALSISNFAPTQAIAAGPWYVAPGGDDANTCLDPSLPCATINGALAKADPGGIVKMATGTYSGSGSEVVLIDQDITLSGGWDASFVTQEGHSVIDGEGARRGMTVPSGVTALVERVTIQNCFDPLNDMGAGGPAGGILNEGALTLAQSTVTGNNAGASDSAAVANFGTITLQDCIVSDNPTGGINNSGSMALIDTVVRGNARAGIVNWTGEATLDRCSVDHNAFRGVYNHEGQMTLDNSAVTDNGTPGNWAEGPGVYNWWGTVTLNNCTVSGNAGSAGGGLYMARYAALNLNSCTVSNNTAYNYGGGMYVEEGVATIRNTLLAGNRGGMGPSDCAHGQGTIVSAGHNLVSSTSRCTFIADATDILDVDACLGPLEGEPGYAPLLPGSPAIDAGDPAGCCDVQGVPLATDQRGFPRFGTCDIGAYELQPLGYSTKTADRVSAYPGDTVHYTITLRNPGETSLDAVQMTDALPSSLAFVAGSLDSTDGSATESGGVIQWSGALNAGGDVGISFAAAVQEEHCFVANTAVIEGGGETITRAATTLQNPVNDTPQTALAAETLPYQDTQDITCAAWEEPVPPDWCDAGNSVWYTYTPTETLYIGIRATNEQIWPTINVYTGQPGAFTRVNCGNDLEQRVEAGVTYYFMVLSWTGETTFYLDSLGPAFAMSMVVDRTGIANPKTGSALISGRVISNEPVDVWLSGELRQTLGRKKVITGYWELSLHCEPGETPWSVTVRSNEGAYGGGPAQLTARLWGCTMRDCLESQVDQVIKLKGGGR